MILLVGPFLVDWTEYKDDFEQYAERSLGQPVSVLGDVDVRLIPAPRINLTDVRVGDPETPLARISSISVIAELPALLKGEVNVRELIMEQPTFEVVLEDDGRLDILTKTGDETNFDSESIRLDQIRIVEGRINILDVRTDAVHTLQLASFNGSARSLSGPFRARGKIGLDDSEYIVDVATGKWEDDIGLMVKANFSTEYDPISVELGGNLTLDGGLPEFAGKFTLGSTKTLEPNVDSLPDIWSGGGEISINPSGLKLVDINIRYGPEDRSIGIQGEVDATFGLERNFNAKFTSKQLNFDRLMGSGPNEPVQTQAALVKSLDLVRNLPVLDFNGRVVVDLPGVVVNGSLVQELVIEADSSPSGWKLNRVEARLPGRSKLSSTGELILGDPIGFQGEFNLEVLQPTTFLVWWLNVQPDESFKFDPFSISLSLDGNSDRLVIPRIAGQLDGEDFSGSVYGKFNLEDSEREISANLKMDRLTLEQIEGITTLVQLAGNTQNFSATGDYMDTELNLRLFAGELDLQKILVTSVDAQLKYSEGNLHVERILARDLAGMRLEATGSITKLGTEPAGAIELDVESRDMATATAVLGKVFPDNVVTKYLSDNSNLYSPMNLNANLHVEPYSGESKVVLSYSGRLADAEIGSSMTLIGNPLEFSDNKFDTVIEIKSAEGTNLLRQLGVGLNQSGELGETNFSVRLNGQPSEDMNFELSLQADRTEMTADGIASMLHNRDVSYDMYLNLRSPDLSNLELLTGLPFPLVDSKAPVDFNAEVSGVGSSFTLSGLRGRFAALDFLGNIEYSHERGRPMIGGQLNVSELDIQSVSELILGREVWRRTGSATNQSKSTNVNSSRNWPSNGFSESFFAEGLVDLTISTKKFELTEDFVLENAAFQLTLKPDELALDDFDGELANGKVRSNILIRQSAGEAGMSGDVRFEGVPLAKFLWRRQNAPIAMGSLDLAVEFEATGRSVAGLVRGLTGGGTFSINKGEMRGLNSEAFQLVVNDADKGMDLEIESVLKSFSKYLETESFHFEKATGNLLIASGQLSVNNVELKSDTAEVKVDGSLDFEDWQLESNWTLNSELNDEFVETKPRVEIRYAGELRHPKRTVDVSRLTSFLAIRAFEVLNRSGALDDEQSLEQVKAVQELKQLQQEEEIPQSNDTQIRPTTSNSSSIGGNDDVKDATNSGEVNSQPSTNETRDAKVEPNDSGENTQGEINPQTEEIRTEDRLGDFIRQKSESEPQSESESNIPTIQDNSSAREDEPKPSSIEDLIEPTEPKTKPATESKSGDQEQQSLNSGIDGKPTRRERKTSMPSNGKLVITLKPDDYRSTMAEMTARVHIPTTPETLARMVGQPVAVKRER